LLSGLSQSKLSNVDNRADPVDSKSSEISTGETAMVFRFDPRAALLAASLTLAAPARADDPKAVAQAAADRWDQSFNTGDMETLTTLYGTDAEVVAKGAPLADASRIRAYFTDVRAKGFADHKIMVQSARAKGDLLIASGRWEATGPGDGGARKTFSGNWVNVLERQGDGWRTVLHTWN
jgi:ketosteroid isomerase-like protein